MPELTAGLRRATGDPSVRTTDLQEFDLPHRRPAVGRIRGLAVTCRGSTGAYDFRLVLKEPRQTGLTLAGSAGPALREALFYRQLAPHLPIRTPLIYAAAPDGQWLLMEALENGCPPETWQAADYRRAIEQLLVLQDRFWGLGDDLAVYAWLNRPLDVGLDVQAQVAEAAAYRLSATLPAVLRHSQVSWDNLFPELIRHMRAIAAVLSAEHSVLVHGDYWPGNIYMDEKGRMAVYDWQHVSIGPGVLDLLSFVQYTRWWYPAAVFDEHALVQHYRQGVAEMTGHTWTDDAWQRLWGHALLWLFLTRWLDVLSSTPASILTARAEPLISLWLLPVQDWLARLFPEAS
ncbi:MAG: hypothetical protein Fur0018_18980 [Anaerolineales bacterium]